MVTVLRQCRSWHVARAKLGVLWATPKRFYLNNRTTAGPIGLRLGIQLGAQQTMHVCGLFLGCFSTRARPHPASISRELALFAFHIDIWLASLIELEESNTLTLT